MAPPAATSTLHPLVQRGLDQLANGPEHDLLIMHGEKHAHILRSTVQRACPELWNALEAQQNAKGMVYLSNQDMLNPELIIACLKWIYTLSYPQATLAIDDKRYMDERTRPLMKDLRIAVYAAHYKLPALATKARANFDTNKRLITFSQTEVRWFDFAVGQVSYTNAFPTKDAYVLRTIQSAGRCLAATRHVITDPAFEAWLVALIRNACKWDIPYDWFHKSLNNELNSFTGKAGIGRTKSGRWIQIPKKK